MLRESRDRAAGEPAAGIARKPAPAGVPRILLVEDDPTVRTMVTLALQQRGYAVHAEGSAAGVAAAVEEFRPDLVVLDVRLPGQTSGLGVARALRAVSDLPVLFLSAADSVEDRLAGFDAGADDYLSKPFSVAELLARVAALLRRSGAAAAPTWRLADLVVEEGGRTATRDGEDLRLTRREFDLLAALARRAGRVLTKTQLLALVWQFDAYDPNLVEVTISTLRRKMEEGGRPRLVQTVRGVGYVLRVA